MIYAKLISYAVLVSKNKRLWLAGHFANVLTQFFQEIIANLNKTEQIQSGVCIYYLSSGANDMDLVQAYDLVIHDHKSQL